MSAPRFSPETGSTLMRLLPLIAVLGLVMLLAGGLIMRNLAPDQTSVGDPRVNAPLPELPLETFVGGRAGFDPSEIEGPYLLNFWASWCTPCLVEHPYFEALADQGVPIIGIVYKDDPADARAFLNRLGDPFAAISADPEGRAGFELGVTGPPETFIIDADGVVRARWRGAVTDLVWLQTLGPIWEDAGGTPVDVNALVVTR